jgi:ankyrin repeat protein
MSFKDIQKAIVENNLTKVKKLVKANPRILGIKSESGETPLYVAIYEGHLEIIQYLVDNGADIDDTYNGESALYITCKHGSHREISIEIIEYLLDVVESDEDEYDEDKYINKKGKKGYFTLYIACDKGDHDIVNLLLERGADINQATDDGTTALIIAVQENKDNSHLEIIETLLQAGANTGAEDNEDNTALHYAEENDDAEVIELLEQYPPQSPSPSPSPSSSPSPSPSPIKSKSFSVGSVEPALLDVVEVNKSQIPETAEDFINMEDVNIVDFLAENDKNMIIKVHNSFYAIGGEDIKTHFLTGKQKNKYIYYPCKRALPPPSLAVGKNDVYMDKPLFSASYLAPIADFILLKELFAMFESKNKYFEIITSSDVEDIPATATAQMFTKNAYTVGANHCQEGKAAKIFKVKMINIVEPKEKSVAKKRRTRKARVKIFHLKKSSVSKRKTANNKISVKKRKSVNKK